jgi:hypothetical protein
VVCCEYVNVVRLGRSAEVCLGDKESSIWSFSLFCESHNDWWIVVGKEFDEFHTFNPPVPQSDSKQVVVLVGWVIAMVAIWGAG